MIVINSEKGKVFVNEAEIVEVRHHKIARMVTVVPKSGCAQNYYQVDDVYYTNKKEVEIHDNGLLLSAAIKDAEYYKEMNRTSEDFIKELGRLRQRLENFIIENFEEPSDSQYCLRFIETVREEHNKRPDDVMDELKEKRDYPFYTKIRNSAENGGKQIEKEIANLTKELDKQSDFAKRYEDAYYRIMKRNLWQRILNKSTYL